MISKLFNAIGSSWRALTFTSGKFSHLKMWSNIALCIATWVVFKLTMQEKLTVDIFVVYLAAATGARITDKYLMGKQEVTRYQSQLRYERPLASAKTPREDFE
jgi:hypothetical protein